MMLRWFGPFGGIVRVALVLALLALVALALMIMGRAALTIYDSIEAPPASPAPLPTVGGAPTSGAAPTAPLPTGGAAPTARAGGAPDAAPPTDSSSVAAHGGAIDAAPLRDALLAAWQCDRARRGLPPLIIDPMLDAAAADLHRVALIEGRPALESAAARYYEVRIGALPMALVAAMGCDAPAPDGAAPPDAATRRIGLAVIGPPDGGGDSPYAPVSFVLIGVTEERQP